MGVVVAMDWPILGIFMCQPHERVLYRNPRVPQWEQAPLPILHVSAHFVPNSFLDWLIHFHLWLCWLIFASHELFLAWCEPFPSWRDPFHLLWAISVMHSMSHPSIHIHTGATIQPMDCHFLGECKKMVKYKCFIFCFIVGTFLFEEREWVMHYFSLRCSEH